MHLVLNRPNVLNSFNRSMAKEFQTALKAVTEDNTVRAVLISGEGRAFSAGQDLGEVAGKKDLDLGAIVNECFNPIIKGIRLCEKPFVSAVNGVAAGAGANIALACDVVVASKEATFIQSFSKIGLIPDSGGTFILPRLVGYGRACALTMLGSKISAEEAQSLGLIYKIFDGASLLEEAQKLADQLAELPTVGLGLTKRALNQSFENSLEEQLELEEELQRNAGRTYDYNEGVTAFIEKRKPSYRGC